jgi:hypothetical protein
MVIPARKAALHNEANHIANLSSQMKQAYEQMRLKAIELESNSHLSGLFAEMELLRDEIKRLQYSEAYLSQLISVEEAVGVLSSPSYCSKKQELDAFKSVQSILEESTSVSLQKRCQSVLEAYKPDYLSKCMAELTAAANACQWPRPVEVDLWDNPEVIAFVEAASVLVSLKTIFGEDGRRSLVKILLGPIAIRFSFHFETEAQGDAPDRPDWFLDYLSRVTQEHASFLTDYLGEILPANGPRPFLDLFIDELAGLAKSKLVKIKPAVEDNGILLSSTILSVAKFYRNLRDRFGYVDESQSCLALFLGDDLLMDRWVEIESAALTKSLNELNLIPYSQLVTDVSDLFESVTLLYEDLEDASIRSRFFVTLQVPLLEHLYKTIEFSLPVFHSSSEDLALFVQAANAIDQFVGKVRGDWTNALCFLELAQAPECHQAIGYDPSELSGGLFSKTLGAFTELLEQRILSQHIFGHLMGQFLHHASPYAKAMHYGVMRSSGDPIDMHEGLQNSIVALNNSLKSLKDSLASHLSRFIEAELLQALSDFFFKKVILKNYFHAHGAQAFKRDMEWTLEQLSGVFTIPITAEHFAKTHDSIKVLLLSYEEHQGLLGTSTEILRLKAMLNRIGVLHLDPDEAIQVLRLIKRM